MEYEDWLKLYRENPARFEFIRKSMIEQEINAAPIEYRNKMRMLQWQIDAIRDEHGSKEALQLISKLMIKSLDTIQEEWVELALAVSEVAVIKKDNK
jgi:hypothetical protein